MTSGPGPSAPELRSQPAQTLGAGDDAQLQPQDLQPLSLLHGAGREAVWELLVQCPVRVLTPGEVLIKAGQPNDTMHMILSGKLRVHLQSQDTDPVAWLEPGQTVGELSVLDDSPTSAFVVAENRSRLLAVDEETFWRLVGASHEFATNLLLLLARRMRASNSRLAESARLQRRLERDAMFDALTGVHNRRWLDEKLPRIVERHRRGAQRLSIFLIDVDHFKTYNDSYGHLAGDQVLIEIARLIMTCLRPTDLGARYGGEEFVVILPDTPLSGAVTAADRLRRACCGSKIYTVEGASLPTVTISVGVTEVPAQDTAESVLSRADAALYEAKRGGRDRVEVARRS
jgi:diguanylate cyclase (GGDEF)-like protein